MVCQVHTTLPQHFLSKQLQGSNWGLVSFFGLGIHPGVINPLPNFDQENGVSDEVITSENQTSTSLDSSIAQ